MNLSTSKKRRTDQNRSGEFTSTGGNVAWLKTIFIPLSVLVIFTCISLSSRNMMPTATGGSRLIKVIAPMTKQWTSAGITSQNTIRHIYTKTSSMEVDPESGHTDSVMLQRNASSQSGIACKPVQKVVYIKTHKTGSTTLASIFERYGYIRNLSFAMAKSGHILSSNNLFKMSMTYQIPNRTRHDFDMLVNHVRYSRTEMDIAVPNAKYVSIIRHPVTQLESAFGYFEMAQHLKLKSPNPFQTFMSNPRIYYAKKFYFWDRSRNGQLFDFGFNHKNDENITNIKEIINKLSNEIDLMIINEYFDESLVLLRKLLCWEYEDILFISNGIRSKSHRYPVTKSIADKVKSWSAGDMMLYDRFNQTFWKKVKDYGSTFDEDLAHFRNLEAKVMNDCIASDQKDRKDRREEKFILRTHSQVCENLLRGDVDYARLIRKGMVTRAASEAAERLKQS